MSSIQAYFIGGPLDGEEHLIDANIDTFIVPEVAFTWTEVDGIAPREARIHHLSHRYQPHTDVKDTFIYDGATVRGR